MELSVVLGSGEAQEVEILDFTAKPLRLEAEQVEEVEENSGSEEDEPDDSGILGAPNTTSDIVVAWMAGKGSDVHQVQLPPLNILVTLDSLMPDLRVSPVLGLYSPKWRGVDQFTIPVGDADRPLEQRRDIFTPDLSGAGGHLVIIGGLRSGRSTFARTAVGVLALTHTPIEIQVYATGPGGGTFVRMRDLAHMSGAALRSNETRVCRMFAEIKSIADDRERYFVAQGIESMAAYRRMRAEGKADDGYGDIFLVVDGWQALRSDLDELKMRLQDLILRGLSFGMHVIAAALRWMNFHTAAKDMSSSRVELRLGDALDSEINRRLSWNAPTGVPGCGLEPSKHHILGALPRVDVDHNPESLSEGVTDLVKNVNKLWTGPWGLKLRVLPDKVSIEQVRRRVSKDDRRVFPGLGESRLEPFGIGFDANSHSSFFGGQKPGKTVTSWLICLEIARLYTPQQAQILAVDYRDSFLGGLPEGYVGRHLRNAVEATKQFNGLAQFLATRVPGSDVTTKQLRERSWWKGPEAWAIVDDHDLVDNSRGNPVRVLVSTMAQVRDVGLHTIVARRMGGASRAMYGPPVIQMMNDLVSPAVPLPGNPEEGTVFGRTRPQEGMPGRGQFRPREVNRELIQVVQLDPAVSFDQSQPPSTRGRLFRLKASSG